MIKIETIKIDDEALKSSILEATDLNDNEAMFAKLTEISKAKKELSDALDQITSLESLAKSEIDSRAKTLYGNDWQAIAGAGYKISRSFTGAVYNISPDVKPAKKYLVIKESINTKVVEAELEVSGKLPKGIEPNKARGTMIRISLK